MRTKTKKFISYLNRRYISLVVIVCISLRAGYSLWNATKYWGIGVGYDSFFYVTSASNFLKGLGLSIITQNGEVTPPLMKFPPLYPLVLASASKITGRESEIAARWVSIGLYILSTFLIGWLIYHYSKSLAAGALGSIIAVSNSVWMKNFTKAMSEPLFIVLLLLALFSLSIYKSTRMRKYIFFAGILSGLCLLTRYIGGSMLVFGFVILILFSRELFKNRLIDFSLFFVAAGLVISPWVIYNVSFTSSLTDRKFDFHPPSWEKFSDQLPKIYDWLLSINLSDVIEGRIFFVFLIGLILITYLWKRNIKDGIDEDQSSKDSLQFVWLLIIYAFVYLILLLISMSFFDASTPFNDRILAPIYVVVLISSILILKKGIILINHRALNFFLAVVSLFLIGFNLQINSKFISRTQWAGMGFSGRYWQKNETILEIKQLDPQILIYTNDNFAVYYLTGIITMDVPEKVNQMVDQVNSDYFSAIAEMHDRIYQEKGILVLFDTILNHKESYTIEELTNGLILWKKNKGGWIYIHPEGIPDFVEPLEND